MLGSGQEGLGLLFDGQVIELDHNESPSGPLIVFSYISYVRDLLLLCSL